MFHDTAAEAEADGFRACKRCRPEVKHGDGDPQKIAVEKACDLVRKEQIGNEDGKWTVKGLATKVGLTESHFCRIFKKVTGMTVGEYRASILPGPPKHSAEIVSTDGQHIYDLGQYSQEPLPTPSLPDTYGTETPLSLADLNCSDLEEDWHCFIEMPPTMDILSSSSMRLNIDFDEFSSDQLLETINQKISEDSFQFLNQDYIDSADILS